MTGMRPDKIATVGDNPEEDGKIPQSCGVARSFILDRKSPAAMARRDNFTFVNDARVILSEL
jgi:hypothetical protein